MKVEAHRRSWPWQPSYGEGVQLLLSKGVDANSKDSVGGTPLQRAAVLGNDTTVKILLEHGARVGRHRRGHARLWIKGTSEGKAFERWLWFSDIYVRTAHGWRYAFGQASLSLPTAQ